MFKLYSKGCEYVIRCLSHISEADCEKGFSLEAVCKKSRTPKWFSRKIFQTLAQKGFLTAKRGPGGGYKFKIHPSKIPILDIIQAVDGNDVFSRCVIWNSKCKEKRYCSLHSIWNGLKKELVSQLETNTVSQLLEKNNHL